MRRSVRIGSAFTKATTNEFGLINTTSRYGIANFARAALFFAGTRWHSFIVVEDLFVKKNLQTIVTV